MSRWHKGHWLKNNNEKQILPTCLPYFIWPCNQQKIFLFIHFLSDDIQLLDHHKTVKPKGIKNSWGPVQKADNIKLIFGELDRESV